MIKTYCDACGARLGDAHEDDVMVYFEYTPETYVYRLYHFCSTCSINMREVLRLMRKTGDKANAERRKEMLAKVCDARRGEYEQS